MMTSLRGSRPAAIGPARPRRRSRDASSVPILFPATRFVAPGTTPADRLSAAPHERFLRARFRHGIERLSNTAARVLTHGSLPLDFCPAGTIRRLELPFAKRGLTPVRNARLRLSQSL